MPIRRPVFQTATSRIALLFGVLHRCSPRMGYEGSAVQSHCACSVPKSVHKRRVGLAGPVVQVRSCRARRKLATTTQLPTAPSSLRSRTDSRKPPCGA